MTQRTLRENPSRIHWTTVVSLILWVSAFCLRFLPISFFTSIDYLVLLLVCSLLSFIMGIIAIVLSRKPAWKKGFGWALFDIIMSSVMILYSAYGIFLAIAFVGAFTGG